MDAAIPGDLFAEQDVDVGESPGVGNPARQRTQRDAARAVVALKLRVGVNLSQRAVDYGEFPSRLSVVQFRARNGQLALNRYVPQKELGTPFPWSKSRRRTHRYSVTVGVLEPLVDPISGVVGEVVGVQLPGGDQHLPQPSVHDVAVRVHVEEGVVKLHELKLVVGIPQGLLIPDSNVIQGGSIFLNRSLVQKAGCWIAGLLHLV